MMLEQFPWFVPAGAVLGLCLILMWVTFQRAIRLRDRQVVLVEEYHRLRYYAECRLAAQRAQVAADQATSDADRAAHLREAIGQWREANQHRDLDDDATWREISAQIEMLQADLARLEPETAADAPESSWPTRPRRVPPPLEPDDLPPAPSAETPAPPDEVR